MTAGPAAPTRRSTAGRVLVVRPLTAADVETTAALQACAPPCAALDVPAALGGRFLRRWHLAHLTSPHAVGLVAEQVDDDGAGRAAAGPRTTGVLLAVLDRRAHREHVLRQHAPQLAAALAGSPRRAPGALAGWARLHAGPFAQAMTLLPTRGGAAARARRTESGADQRLPAASVEALVVDPQARGAGVGRQLLAGFAAQATDAGLERVEARVPWGTGVEGFFTACGWTASPIRPSGRGGFETRIHLDL